MIYVVIAHDHPDALDTRMAVREHHLKKLAQAKSEGILAFVSALKDDDGRPIGSLVVFDVESRQVVDDYIASEPYVLNNVWGEIEIREGAIPELDSI